MIDPALLRDLFVEHNLDDGNPRVRDFGFTKGRALDMTNALPSELAEGPYAVYERGENETVYCTGEMGGSVFRQSHVVRIGPVKKSEEVRDWLLTEYIPQSEQAVKSVEALGPDVRRFELAKGVTLVAPGPIGIHVTSGDRESWVVFSNRYFIERA